MKSETLMSVVIPTYGREQVLLDTLTSLHRQGPGEVIVVDQTPDHQPATEYQLQVWNDEGRIRWVQQAVPSIPQAMNAGLQAAQAGIVLFLDDDIIPDSDLVEAHQRAHAKHPEAWAVVGQVLQPGEESASRDGWIPVEGFQSDFDFPFWSDELAWVSNVMAGNLSVKRDKALSIGGFDERFIGSAYRFETEFARRVVSNGGRILFEPTASIRHLRAARGGTRAGGSHLTSASPRHGMGDYYFALRSGLSRDTVAYMAKRPFREVATRFHLRHPWYIPVKFIGEMRAFAAALRALWGRSSHDAAALEVEESIAGSDP